MEDHLPLLLAAHVEVRGGGLRDHDAALEPDVEALDVVGPREVDIVPQALLRRREESVRIGHRRALERGQRQSLVGAEAQKLFLPLPEPDLRLHLSQETAVGFLRLEKIRLGQIELRLLLHKSLARVGSGTTTTRTLS